MDELNINRIISALFFGIGSVVAYTLIKWVKGYFDAKHKADVLEIDIQSRTITDYVNKLNDDELIARANKRNEGSGSNSSKE